MIFQQHQEAYKFKKNVQKLINAKNEKETKEKAQNFDKKDFLTVNTEAGASKKWLNKPAHHPTDFLNNKGEKSSRDRLLDNLLFYVPLKNFSLLWRPHH